MFSHFLTTALRYFFKQKIYSVINLPGLAAGLASVILISLWIRDELNVDMFHANKDDIFQVFENQTYDGGQIYTFSATPGVLAETLKKDFPEVKEAVRTSQWKMGSC